MEEIRRISDSELDVNAGGSGIMPVTFVAIVDHRITDAGREDEADRLVRTASMYPITPSSPMVDSAPVPVLEMQVGSAGMPGEEDPRLYIR